MAAGGGEAAGAGRAGGIVGIDDFGTDLGAVAERVAVAEPVDVVGDAADGAAERLSSADGADVGFAAAADRVAEAFGAAELAARACAVAVVAETGVEADPSAEADPDAEADVGAAGVDPAADPVAAPEAVDADPAVAPEAIAADPGNVDSAVVFRERAWADVAPAGVAVVFVDATDVRGGAPAAGADVFEAGGVASAAEAAARGDFRGPEVDVEDAADVALESAFALVAGVDADAVLGVGVAGAAERVGGVGASPDPRSEASSKGEAQVPEYAASAGAAAHEPEVEVPAEAPDAVEALAVEPGEAVGLPDAADALDAVGLPDVAEALGGLELAAADLAATWPDVAPVTGGIPNPAGDLTESVAVDDLAAAAVVCRGTGAAGSSAASS